ncbi:hypothetical protein CCUS01_00733 [Colletotrichum cuscutae]|uniref:Uncharacterized protein n=1 Tax=Colletotrichum cuscutae TaxID=1209917 RepID=A0AAI9VD98_9PEZI|nr:hypothetical protein CCUS01_00733 [Colletotrichum cuscutae]
MPIPRSQVQLSPQNLGKALAAACHGTGERVAGERTWKLKLAKVTGGPVPGKDQKRTILHYFSSVAAVASGHTLLGYGSSRRNRKLNRRKKARFDSFTSNLRIPPAI